MTRIPVAGPWITQKEIDYVSDAVKNCWYEDANKYNDIFEKAFATYIGVKHAVALPSCTSAIHLSLAALGVGPGDEVIVPDVTWIASAAPISYVGATPIFADIEDETWCLSPESCESLISERTRAIIVVDLYGNMPRMNEILAIARRNNIPVIEDAAEAFGSEFCGRKAGSFGETGVFSFHGSKTMTTGEGGMLVTNSDAIYRRVLVLRDHGRQPGDKAFFNSEVAYKYKMSSVQAAMGLAQLERADELVSRKRQIFSWYSELLGDLPGVELNPEGDDVKNSYWMSTVVFKPELGLTKDDIISSLRESGIDSRPFFHPLSSLPAYSHTHSAIEARRNNASAYRVSTCGVNLPCSMMLTRDECERTAASVREIVRSAACGQNLRRVG